LIGSSYRQLAKRPLSEILYRDVGRDLFRSCQEVPDRDLAKRALLESLCRDLIRGLARRPPIEILCRDIA